MNPLYVNLFWKALSKIFYRYQVKFSCTYHKTLKTAPTNFRAKMLENFVRMKRSKGRKMNDRLKHEPGKKYKGLQRQESENLPNITKFASEMFYVTQEQRGMGFSGAEASFPGGLGLFFRNRALVVRGVRHSVLLGL